MYVDILIFAAIAAFLIYRLNAALGTRHGGERNRPNPFASKEPTGEKEMAAEIAAPAAPVEARLAGSEELIGGDVQTAETVREGLADIAAADASFDPHGFLQGARMAFEMVVTAYSRGDRETLQPLLSPKLFADFSGGIGAREAAGQTSELELHRIKAARIIEARLAGTMAYVTVDFDVEETHVLRGRDGKVVDGDPDRVFSVEDIWTFTRDVRAEDPNWMLIETRTVEA